MNGAILGFILTSLKFLDESGSTLNLKVILNTDINAIH